MAPRRPTMHPPCHLSCTRPAPAVLHPSYHWPSCTHRCHQPSTHCPGCAPVVPPVVHPLCHHHASSPVSPDHPLPPIHIAHTPCSCCPHATHPCWLGPCLR